MKSRKPTISIKDIEESIKEIHYEKHQAQMDGPDQENFIRCERPDNHKVT